MDKLTIISLYSRGQSLRKIAKMLGHSRQTVTSYVREYEATKKEIDERGETEELKAKLLGAPKRKKAPRACTIYVGDLKKRFEELSSDPIHQEAAFGNPKKITAAMISRQLKEEGYAIGDSTVRLKYRKVKEERGELK